MTGVLPVRLLSGTVVSAMGRVVGTAISVLTIGIVTRGLAATGGVAAYGAYATVFAVLSVVAVVADGGLFLVFTRAAARLAADAEAPLFRLLLRVRLLTFLAALAVTAGAVFLLPYPPLVRLGILLGATGIFAQLTSQLALGVFQKRLRMLTPALAEVGGRSATLLLALLAAWAGRGLLAYVGAFIVGASVTLLWNLLGTRRFLAPQRQESIPPRRPPLTTAAVLREAWPLGLLLICSLIVFRADSVLLSLLRPPEDLGWYALPYKVLESLLFFPAMIGGLLFPALSRAAPRAASGADLQAFRATLGAATQLFLLLAVPTVLLLAVAAPWIIAILGGPAFTPSIPVLRILAVALGALFFGNLYGNSAIALGAQRALLSVAASLAVGNVAVNLVVIPRYAFLGAAWTTLLTEALSATLVFALVRRRIGGFPLPAPAWHTLSAGGIFLFVTLLPMSPLARVLLGLASYAWTLVLLGVVRPTRLGELLKAQRYPQ